MPLLLRPRLLLAAIVIGALAPCNLAAAQAAPATQAPARTLPERLSDQEFWKLMNDLSEPGGFFRSDNLLSNEAGFQTVIPELLRVTKSGGVYLGVGPEQNFTYIASLHSPMAIIFDIRRGNTHMHLLYKALFELSADRAEFVSRLFSKPRPAKLDASVTIDSLFGAYWHVASDSVLYRRNLAAVKDHLVKRRGFALTSDDLTGIEFIYEAFYMEGPVIDYSYPRSASGRYPNYADLMVQSDGHGVQRSYLANEAAFRRIRDLQTRNLIVPVVGDFGGPKAIRAAGEYLKERNATVAAIYVSNVEQYLFQSGDAWQRYYESVATLPTDSTTTFIRSVGGGFGGGARGMVRLPSVLSYVQELVTAYREGLVTSYYDVIQLSR